MIFDNSFIWSSFLEIALFVYVLIGLLYASYIIFYLRLEKTSDTLSYFYLNLSLLISQMFVLLIHQKNIAVISLILIAIILFLISYYKTKQKETPFYFAATLYFAVLILNIFYNDIAFFIAEFVVISFAFHKLYSRWFKDNLPIKLIVLYFVLIILSGIVISKTFNDFQKNQLLQLTNKTWNIHQRFEVTTEYFETFLKSALMMPQTRKVIFDKDAKNGHFHFLRLAHIYKADKVYFIDKTGTTIIASDWKFFGKNYGFRPYFLYALKGKINYFIAKGVTSGQIGVYFGFPVYDKNNEHIIGALVFKYNLSKFLDSLDKNSIMLMHKSGVVLFGPDAFEDSCIDCSRGNIEFALRNHILGNSSTIKKTNYHIVNDKFLCKDEYLDDKCLFLIRYPLTDSDYYIIGVYPIAPLYNYKNKLFTYWMISLLLLSLTLFEIIRNRQKCYLKQ